MRGSSRQFTNRTFSGRARTAWPGWATLLPPGQESGIVHFRRGRPAIIIGVVLWQAADDQTTVTPVPSSPLR